MLHVQLFVLAERRLWTLVTLAGRRLRCLLLIGRVLMHLVLTGRRLVHLMLMLVVLVERSSVRLQLLLTGRRPVYHLVMVTGRSLVPLMVA